MLSEDLGTAGGAQCVELGVCRLFVGRYAGVADQARVTRYPTCDSAGVR